MGAHTDPAEIELADRVLLPNFQLALRGSAIVQ